ncbi:MAG: DUF47 family protein [Candidatus Aenigmarchaeota archaeon]|nr:DUF47 family protein [Candidatus Aenigmarchaeota archaeon]
MGFREWLLPKDHRFFDMLENQAQVVFKGSSILAESLNSSNGIGIGEKVKLIKKVEQEGDEIVHEIAEGLNRTLITPIDREDISNLSSRLDDVLDKIHAAASRINIYGINPNKTILKLSNVLVTSTDILNKAVRNMRNPKKFEETENYCIEINRLENEADSILHSSLSELFKEKDILKIIKLKEIMEFLEEATDRCEDAANTISDIIVKNR